MKKILGLVVMVLLSQAIVAQHDHSKCGMTIEDQAALIQFVQEYNSGKHQQTSTKRDELLNVPIKFHLVAKSDGTGRINPIPVYKQFERMRKDFLEADMNLYLKDGTFNYLDNTAIYSNPGTAGNIVQSAKDKEALNMFITQNANTSSGNGTVLGFYDPSRDYIIIRITDVLGATSSLSHELGHMFSLPHTFFGWEQEPYDEAIHGNPCLLTTAPGTSIPVELVDGSNCTSAADRICDTPPDYNFGFTAGGCSYTPSILDRNGDLIEPMIDNYMGYFIGCDKYVFTEGQIAIMRANWALNNYNGNDRTFLRDDYAPTTDSVSHDYELLSPANMSTTDTYNYIALDWEDAEGATAYQLEITAINLSNGSTTFTEAVADESIFVLTELNPNEVVSWTVKPFNESYGGAPVKSATFTTGAGVSSTGDLDGLLNALTVGPNPVMVGQELNVSLDMEAASDVKISLHDITGKLILDQVTQLQTGLNTLQLSTESATTGIHLLQISTGSDAVYKKVIIE